MARKVVLSVIAVALASNARAQVQFGLLTMFVCCVLHARCMPFAHDTLDHFEALSLLCCTLTFFCGIFTTDTDAAGVTLASGLAIAVNVLYVAATIPIALSIHKDNKRYEKVKEALKPQKPSQNGQTNLNSKKLQPRKRHSARARYKNILAWAGASTGGKTKSGVSQLPNQDSVAGRAVIAESHD